MADHLRCILLDLDGTLVDSLELEIVALERVLERRLGRKYTRGELAKTMGIPTLEAAKLFTNEDVEGFATAWAAEVAAISDQARPFPGVIETLDYLAARYVLGLVTSRTRVEMEELLQKTDLYPYFAARVSADDTLNTKPHAEPLEKALKLLSAEPGEAVYIGDSALDMQCAKRAGVARVGRADGCYQSKRAAAMGP